MTKNVISIDLNDTIFNACLKYRNKIGCLIVTKKEQCICISIERDIIERAICQCRDFKKNKIKEIISNHIITIHQLDKVEKAI